MYTKIASLMLPCWFGLSLIPRHSVGGGGGGGGGESDCFLAGLGLKSLVMTPGLPIVCILRTL